MAPRGFRGKYSRPKLAELQEHQTKCWLCNSERAPPQRRYKIAGEHPRLCDEAIRILEDRKVAAG